MALYTFIMDFAGGTYVSQVVAENPKAACLVWAQSLAVEQIANFGSKSKNLLVEKMRTEEPTALQDAMNTWFALALLPKGAAHINFVRTVADES